MITAYRRDEGHVTADTPDPASLSDEAVWIDLHAPSAAEIDAVETMCQVEVPTREEMGEIEVSSRLYSEPGADVLTAEVPHGLESGRAAFAPVTFILSRERLITLRYTEPKSFAIYAAKLCRTRAGRGATISSDTPAGTTDDAFRPEGALIGLLETIIDRVADLLESVSADLDRIGDDIFRSSEQKKPAGTDDFKTILRRIGRAGDLTSRVRESLATFDRLIPYLQLVLDRRKHGQRDAKARMKMMARDVASLNDFVSFLSNKTTFLLDTTVGMISIEQNAIIKIFSVAAVAFLPPTLVASIYGMNFQFMPELGWDWGYPYALGLMLVTAIVPMIYFRIKHWL